jgi:hypothetical protein
MNILALQSVSEAGEVSKNCIKRWDIISDNQDWKWRERDCSSKIISQFLDVEHGPLTSQSQKI